MSDTPKFFQRSMSRKAGTLLSGAALVVGVAMGATSGTTTQADELDQLRSENTNLSGQLADSQDAAEDAAEASAKQTEVTDDLQARVAELEQKITDAQKKVKATTALVEDRDARIEKLEGQVANASNATVEPETYNAPPESTYFQNCTAAREAHAAPVHIGDPGYGPHLDRDWDGIGCE